MSENRSGTGPGAAQRAATGAGRAMRAYRALPQERRLAAGAALGMFFSLFLPWYQETVIAPNKVTALQTASVTITGWGAFSFVEAALLLVSAGVITLLFQRAEGRAFHLPGGDGWVITAAGFWTCVLVIWRIFDKQSTSVHGAGATTSGIEWGIFIALAIAALLAYAGTRIRAAARPEPPLPGESAAPAQAEAALAHAQSQAEPPAPPPEREIQVQRGPVPPPRPVAADDPPTEVAPTRELAPDQLTIPFERGGED